MLVRRCASFVQTRDALFAVLQAGEFLNLLSGALPFVGGLAGFAAEALKVGDNNIQTRRVIKVRVLSYTRGPRILTHLVHPRRPMPAQSWITFNSHGSPLMLDR